MYQNLLKDAKFVKASNGATAGTTAVTSSTIDAAGYDSVLWIVDFAAIVDGSVIQATAQDGAAANGSDAANITDQGGNTVQTGSLTASSSGNGQALLDVQRPLQRYQTLVVTRTTQDATINSITAILYNAVSKPVAQPSTVIASAEFLAAS